MEKTPAASVFPDRSGRVAVSAVDAQTSFVIATKDRVDSLTETLLRLLSDFDEPIIVVDNGSRDGTAASVERLRSAHRRGHRLRLIRLNRNGGAAARNIGVAAASGPYVAFCDDDSWWGPPAVGIAEEAFGRHADVAVLAGRTIVEPTGTVDPFCAQLADSPLGARPELPGPSILGFQACAVMVRRSAFLAAGGFSRLLHFGGEEQLLAIDLAAAGWQLCYLPAMTAHHAPSPRRSEPAARQARLRRNDLLTACLRRPWARCLASAKTLLRTADDRPHRRAAVEAAVRLPVALSKRRPVPAGVERRIRRCEADAGIAGAPP